MIYLKISADMQELTRAIDAMDQAIQQEECLCQKDIDSLKEHVMFTVAIRDALTEEGPEVGIRLINT